MTSTITSIPDETERHLLFAALYARYGMWEASFIINGSDISANQKWWHECGLWNKAIWIEIQAYCKGWLDARKPANPPKNESQAASIS